MIRQILTQYTLLLGCLGLGFLVAGCDRFSDPSGESRVAAQPPATATPASEKTANATASEKSPQKSGPAERSTTNASDSTGRSSDSSPASPESNPEPQTTKPEPQTTKPDEGELPEGFPFRVRISAPSLEGGVAWINCAGPLDIRDLKGKWVVIDFWTYCCINCMHILPELKKLEHAHPDDLVVIGVHSAKFDAEKDSQHIAEAVLRYEIEHPIVNDAEQKIWDRYGVSAWPSLRIVDPEGNFVGGLSSEFNWQDLDRLLREKSPYYEKLGAINHKPLKFDQESSKVRATPLRFPGKVLADEASGRLFIADSNHNRIVVSKLSGELITTIGTGAIGTKDGNFTTVEFNHPQGMALQGETLFVADTENHLLRKIDLQKQSVVTIAGNARQARGEWPGLDVRGLRKGDPLPEKFVGPPSTTGLNSPWDLWIHDKDLFIAMAGPHQIWKMPLDESEIGVYSGNGREDIADGELSPVPYERGYASFAQPSGLTSDGKTLFVADSEGSSIRTVPFDDKTDVGTVVGTANLPHGRLFRFGDVDGKGDDVRLQHCLGVAYHEGLIYIADTYNNKIKSLDPAAATVKTLVGDGKPGTSDQPAQFNQPAGISYAAGKLYVADTNNHLIRTIDLQHENRVETLTIAALQPPAVANLAAVDTKPSFPNPVAVKLKPVTVKATDGKIHLAVKLQLPTGFKINAQAPMRYYPEATAETGVVQRESLGKSLKVDPPAAEFDIALPVTAESGEDALKISLSYNYCQSSPDGECKIGSVIWSIPLKLSATAEGSTIPLEFEAP